MYKYRPYRNIPQKKVHRLSFREMKLENMIDTLSKKVLGDYCAGWNEKLSGDVSWFRGKFTNPGRQRFFVNAQWIGKTMFVREDWKKIP